MPPIPSDAVKTPRQSGSLESWPMYVEFATEVEKAAHRRVETYMRRGQRYYRLVEIANEAARLRAAFEFWEHGTPGDELRRGAIAKLLDLRAEAKDLGADL